MNCKVCGYTLAPRDSTCPNCRVPIRRRWTHKVSLRTIRHLALAFALIVLPLLPHLFEWLQFQLPLRTSPMVREALQRVIDDPRVVAALGQPVRARWSVVGYIRSDETGWSEGRLWIPVWGPKGEGTIYARAGRGAGPWVFTNLECRCKEGAVINFLDVPPAPVGVAPRGQVYLAHLGPPGQVSIDSLDDYYRQHLGLSVTLLPPIAVDPGAFDAARGQFVAERVIGSMKRSLPALAADPTVTVIGLLEDDMYIAALNWRFAFNFREGDHFAVVSSRRMVPSFHSIWKRDALLQSRVRKMITKDVGILAYGLPLSSDPTSLLYRDVQGVDDLDLVQERFDGLGQLAEISPTVLSHREKAIQPEIRPRSKNAGEADGRYPCFVVRPGAGWDGVSPIDARVTECLPGLRAERTFDEFELNLQWRYLVTRQTDLFVNDTPPLALTRCSRDFDSISRAFGIGWNHPYDILPAGSRNPYTYIDIIMPDGGLIHYDRISEGTGYADALYEHTATSTAFLHSEFQWNGDGWNLRFTDGSLFVFPENYSGTRANQGAPTEMRDGNGHLTRFQRDRGRNLERLTSPGGRFIRFEHDASSRVTMATDEAAHTVRYEYDAGGRLASVTNAGVVLRYRYVGTDLAAIDNGSRSMLRVERERGRVSRLQLADGRSFRFSFVPSSPGGIQGTTIVEAPDGTRTEVAVAEGQ